MDRFRNIIRDLEEERERIDAAIEALRAMGHASNNHNQATRRGPRRQMSAAARKRIADAQRRRWARWKAKQKRA